jgi:hypothetical protein
MKLFAQHGYGDANKTNDGLAAGYLAGVILRPRDLSPDRLTDKCREVRSQFGEAEVLFDPQLYAGILAADPNANLGKLEEYEAYFGRLMVSRLEVEAITTDRLRRTLEFERRLGVTRVIAPNIVIRRSFDSREAVVSKTFIRLTSPVWSTFGDPREVYATLAVSRDALVNHAELQEFLNDITALDDPPHGFYVLVAARSSEVRADIYHADVIAGWLLLVYSLHINGFRVVNGYSDIVTLLIGAVGADAGATGWWSNSRIFSLDQFIMPPPGGRLPIQRYLSTRLLNRIRFDELSGWRALVPEVLNELPTDEIFETVGEPERSREVLQSWEAIDGLIRSLVREEIPGNLQAIADHIQGSMDLYARLESLGIRPDPKSNRDHLEPMQEGIRLFRRLAEV